MKRVVAIICAMAMLFSCAGVLANDEYDVITLPESAWVYGQHCFHDGYAPVMTDEGWRYVDVNGNIMPWSDFTTAFAFSDGLAAVEKDGKIGYIDTTGALVIGFESDARFSMGTTYAGRFIDGKAVAMKNNSGQMFETPWEDFSFYYINKQGENVGEVDAETAQELIINDSYGCFTDNTISLEINGAFHGYIPMDEDAALVLDVDASYIVKKKGGASAPAPAPETSAPSAAAGTPSDWAAAEVEKATQYGLLGDWVTDYQKPITREEFATLIVTCVLKTSGKTLDGFLAERPDITDTFTDTDNLYVTTAAGMHIVQGVGDGLFAPDQSITRQEIAVMMYRGIQFAGHLTNQQYIEHHGNLHDYDDVTEVASWAVGAVGSLANAGIMKGTAERIISPLENTTTEQAILLAVRLFERMNP